MIKQYLFLAAKTIFVFIFAAMAYLLIFYGF